MFVVAPDNFVPACSCPGWLSHRRLTLHGKDKGAIRDDGDVQTTPPFFIDPF
jgi:hypothetical protein